MCQLPIRREEVGKRKINGHVDGWENEAKCVWNIVTGNFDLHKLKKRLAEIEEACGVVTAIASGKGSVVAEETCGILAANASDKGSMVAERNLRKVDGI